MVLAVRLIQMYRQQSAEPVSDRWDGFCRISRRVGEQVERELPARRPSTTLLRD